MADERLVLGLSSWLRDSEVPPPDTLMSASRVMAGLEITSRLGRFWPPARLTPAVEPAPELGAFGPAGPPPRPVPRVQKPKIKARLRATFTPVRVLAVANVAALAVSVSLFVASMLPADHGASSALVAGATREPTASPTAIPSVVPTATPAATTAPTLPPAPLPTWGTSDSPLDWHTDSVRLEAGAVALTIADKTFTLPMTARVAGEDVADTATLEGGWSEDGIEQQLLVELVRDADTWWIERIRTFDGRRNAGWLDFEDLAARTATPVGQSWSGDLILKSTGAERKTYREPGSGVLTFEALRLTAFGPVSASEGD